MLPGGQVGEGVVHGGGEGGVDEEGGEGGAVDEFGGGVAGHEVGLRGGEVVAARDGDGAQPGLVGARAVGAVACQAVLLDGWGLARDLLEGVGAAGILFWAVVLALT